MSSKGMDIEGKRVTVLGAARSGVAAALLLADRGAEVLLSEKAPAGDRASAVEALDPARIKTEFGVHSPRVYDADIWVISPGIPSTLPVVKEAARRGIPVFGELEIASWFCEAPILAVTGSNGKSTTTALLGAVFEAAGVPCVVAGNIGFPFSRFVPETRADGVAVVEVSSFQLETVWRFHPKVAVLLNLTPDHLDRHGSMAAYGALKARIFENQESSDSVVYNGRDSLVRGLVQRARSRKVSFGTSDGREAYGEIAKGRLLLHLGGDEEEVLPLSGIGIPGMHNAANALAAALAGRIAGAPLEAVRKGLHAFRGLPHRMERVRDVGGVMWVNDSKATNVDSVRYALGSYEAPVILIAGGRDKDSDFSLLKDSVEEHVKAMILMGEAAGKIDRALGSLRPTVFVSSMQEAVECARDLARPGDVVLLSPGCASYDLYRDFEERGGVFRKWVEAL